MVEMTDLEKDAMRMLLAGDDPALAALRAQLESCTLSSREWSGAGFFSEFELAEDAEPAELPRKEARLGDVIADVGGLERGVGFVLFIREGRLHMLEGYTFGEPWPDPLGTYDLRYTASERDLSGLR